MIRDSLDAAEFEPLVELGVAMTLEDLLVASEGVELASA